MFSGKVFTLLTILAMAKPSLVVAQIYANGAFGNRETAPYPEGVLQLTGTQASPNDLPLGRCEGDCDNSRHCLGDLVCYQFGSRNTPIPPEMYCAGQINTAGGAAYDYCGPAADDLCPFNPFKKAPGECGCNVPEGECDGNPSMNGDPHLKTWTGGWFDYMGECDLVLAHVPKFDGESDLRIHARTTIRYEYSYVGGAAVSIGDDILEVNSFGDYALNGIDNAFVDSASQPALRGHTMFQLSGYPIYHTTVNGHKQVFDIILSDNSNITVSNMKDLVSVKVSHGTANQFGNTVGVMGDFHGNLVARDGVTSLAENINALGQEWQVRDNEPMLFRTARAPQYPQKCKLPSNLSEKESRRLGEGVTEEDAKAACAHLSNDEHAFAACVYDVTATNDLETAQSGAY